VQWQVDTSTHRLRTRSWAPDWAQTGTGVSDWQTVAYDIVNTSSQLPFSLQGPTSSYGTRLVNVDLFAQVTAQKGGKPVEITSQLSGRNTLYGYDPGVCSPIPPTS